MRTVFVIGAGANTEIDMPSGKDLKQEIAEHLDFKQIAKGGVSGNMNVYNAMKKYFGINNEHQVFNIAATISEAMPQSISIDNFLDAHRNEPNINIGGKLAIVASILYAESKCHFKYINLYNLWDNILTDTWYPLFFQKISEKCDINEFIERLKNISFIIFNYDRCFEFYMRYAIDSYYKTGERSINVVNQMNIIHPYGVVGDFPKTPFGKSLSPSELIEHCKNIRTFTEESEETRKERASVKQLIDRANRIIFLGFAYHQTNLDLLFDINKPIPKTAVLKPTDKIECYGTGKGISENDRKYIQSLLWRIDPRLKESDISGDSCADFFNNFWYRISFQDDGTGGS